MKGSMILKKFITHYVRREMKEKLVIIKYTNGKSAWIAEAGER